MNVNAVFESVVDGPGVRQVVRVQGCPHRCPGCFVPETHPFTSRQEWTPTALAAELARRGWLAGLTVTGGEPFAQGDLAAFLRAAREQGSPHVVLYSGYTLEALLSRPAAREALLLADVLVDGPFIQSAEALLAFRGSSNQRVLDVPATLQAGRPVLLDWDSRQVIVATKDAVVVPQALLPLAEALGLLGPARTAPVNCAGGV